MAWHNVYSRSIVLFDSSPNRQMLTELKRQLPSVAEAPTYRCCGSLPFTRLCILNMQACKHYQVHECIHVSTMAYLRSKYFLLIFFREAQAECLDIKGVKSTLDFTSATFCIKLSHSLMFALHSSRAVSALIDCIVCKLTQSIHAYHTTVILIWAASYIA